MTSGNDNSKGFFHRLKNLIIGRSRNLQDTRIFHNLSLIAFFAWVGLGSDGLSSSCYGPQEAFIALNGHIYLSVFVALGTVLTIFIIATSYSQIVELFPSGGGGYLVASKLLSPAAGMVSGCALLIDYVLTITVSVASGADALFSILPVNLYAFKLIFALGIVILLTLLNMRGVKESVVALVPIFLAFIVTHCFIILYVVFHHLPNLPEIVNSTTVDTKRAFYDLGLFGVLFLILRAYSMGAGTYTGIEAVSNGLPVLREPRVQTAKKTMTYMAVSLSFIVLGLMLAYLIYRVVPVPGKTLNAVLFERATSLWSKNGAFLFILIALISEATILFVAAQTGFLDSPRVLANMAIDRWFPAKFSTLSDRLVIQNGILISGTLSFLLMIVSRGSVRFLVVLYSINVFITFVLSQLGMVRHWWLARSQVRRWFLKLIINGIGLVLTAFILISMLIFKFNEGGWLTLLITGALICLAVVIKRHYKHTHLLLNRLDALVDAVDADKTGTHVFQEISGQKQQPSAEPTYDPQGKTAVLLVSGFNGMGLHTLFGIIRLFGGVFKNFVFVRVGVLDAGNFKGVQEVENLEKEIKTSTARYVDFMKRNGFYADAITSIGVDVIEESTNIAPQILERYPNAILFGGQLVFPTESFASKILHNYTVFSLQKRLYRLNIPFIILPIRV